MNFENNCHRRKYCRCTTHTPNMMEIHRRVYEHIEKLQTNKRKVRWFETSYGESEGNPDKLNVEV